MWKTIRKSLQKFLVSKTMTNLVLPVLATVPSLLLAESKSLEPWPKWFFDWFNPLVATNPWPRYVLIGWPAVLIFISFIVAKLRDWMKGQENLSGGELSLLLRALDEPVGKKLKRFGKIAKRIAGLPGKPPAGAIFKEITQPAEQIELLIESIYKVFLDGLQRDDDQRHSELKVILAKMVRGKIVSFKYFLPLGAGPKSQVSDLQGRDSAFTRAAETKQIVIIEDISKEILKKQKKQCVKGGDGSHNEGSMICYPVVDQELNDVPFVISIKYADKKHFELGQAKRYKYILQRFSERILMENRLRLIKGAT